jgi:hypothetical protein
MMDALQVVERRTGSVAPEGFSPYVIIGTLVKLGQTVDIRRDFGILCTTHFLCAGYQFLAQRNRFLKSPLVRKFSNTLDQFGSSLIFGPRVFQEAEAEH